MRLPLVYSSSSGYVHQPATVDQFGGGTPPQGQGAPVSRVHRDCVRLSGSSRMHQGHCASPRMPISNVRMASSSERPRVRSRSD